MAKKSPGLTYNALSRREKWKPLPSVVVLWGDADFFKHQLIKRFARELFGDAEPDLRRIEGSDNPTAATVLDELRTPSFFSPQRVVVVEPADAFLAAHADTLLPHIEGSFSGGHLVLVLEKKLDQRTRLAKGINAHGWAVECPQPFDRPPPWETRAPVWDSPLSHWVVETAREKGLRLLPQNAFAIHQRAGTDLAILDEELEKLVTYCRSKDVASADEDAIRAVIGDTREDSVFLLVDLVLEARRRDALETVARLLERGFESARGTLTLEPTGIALSFIASLLPRLRSLRRAHAMRQAGLVSDPDAWVRSGLVARPFLAPFRRQLETVTPRRIVAMFDRLYEIDRAIKSGGDAARLLELFVVEFTAAPDTTPARRLGKVPDMAR